MLVFIFPFALESYRNINIWPLKFLKTWFTYMNHESTHTSHESCYLNEYHFVQAVLFGITLEEHIIFGTALIMMHQKYFKFNQKKSLVDCYKRLSNEIKIGFESVTLHTLPNVIQNKPSSSRINL